MKTMLIDTNIYEELLKNSKEAYEALKDIINAGDNSQPYSPEELESIFMGIVNKLYDTLLKHDSDFE